MTPEEEKAVADKRKLVEVFRSELMAKVDVSVAVYVWDCFPQISINNLMVDRWVRSVELFVMCTIACWLTSFFFLRLYFMQEHNEELHNMEEEMSHLAVFKKELLKKAEEHLDDVHRMEEEQKQLAVFKDELMSKVDEHLTDLHKKEDKAAAIAGLKEEMAKAIDSHERSVGFRASFWLAPHKSLLRALEDISRF